MPLLTVDEMRQRWPDLAPYNQTALDSWQGTYNSLQTASLDAIVLTLRAKIHEVLGKQTITQEEKLNQAILFLMLNTALAEILPPNDDLTACASLTKEAISEARQRDLTSLTETCANMIALQQDHEKHTNTYQPLRTGTITSSALSIGLFFGIILAVLIVQDEKDKNQRAVAPSILGVLEFLSLILTIILLKKMGAKDWRGIIYRLECELKAEFQSLAGKLSDFRTQLGRNIKMVTLGNHWIMPLSEDEAKLLTKRIIDAYNEPKNRDQEGDSKATNNCEPICCCCFGTGAVDDLAKALYLLRLDIAGSNSHLNYADYIHPDCATQNQASNEGKPERAPSGVACINAMGGYLLYPIPEAARMFIRQKREEELTQLKSLKPTTTPESKRDEPNKSFNGRLRERRHSEPFWLKPQPQQPQRQLPQEANNAEAVFININPSP